MQVALTAQNWRREFPVAAFEPAPDIGCSHSMPTISKFYGITILLRPAGGEAFPAALPREYGGFEISLAIETGEVLNGTMPRRALVMIVDWASLHRPELLAGWEALKNGRLPDSIAPLD